MHWSKMLTSKRRGGRSICRLCYNWCGVVSRQFNTTDWGVFVVRSQLRRSVRRRHAESRLELMLSLDDNFTVNKTKLHYINLLSTRRTTSHKLTCCLSTPSPPKKKTCNPERHWMWRMFHSWRDTTTTV